MANGAMILGLLLTLALTGLPRLMVTLAMHYDSHDSFGTLSAPRPLFFDKVSSSTFTLTRPKDSTHSADDLDPPATGAFSFHNSGQVELMPRWQRTLFTAAERHKANYV